jgi:hypothetical protein
MRHCGFFSYGEDTRIPRLLQGLMRFEELWLAAEWSKGGIAGWKSKGTPRGRAFASDPNSNHESG